MPRPLLALATLLALLAGGCASHPAPPRSAAASHPARSDAPRLEGSRLDDIAAQERRIQSLREEIRQVRAHLDSIPADSAAATRLRTLESEESEARTVRDDIKRAAEDERLRSPRPDDDARQREENWKTRALSPH